MLKEQTPGGTWRSGTRRAEPRRESFLQKGGPRFSWGTRHVVSWQSPAWQSRCCWRNAGDVLAEATGEGSLLHGEGPRWSCTRPWCSWAHVAAGPQTGSRDPPPQKKPGSEILLTAVFLSPAPKRRSGGAGQRAWARGKSRIPVLGCISRTDTSEQRFLPIGVMEAATNPGVPRLRAAQLSASCLFLGGRGATGRVHFLARIEKRNCADRSS